MLDLKEETVVLTSPIRRLRGESQPILAEANDGLVYVVKFANSFQPNLPFNESMGTELYKLFSLPVPSWRPLQVTSSFIDRIPSCWIDVSEGKLRPDRGLCLGSQFLGGEGNRIFEILPGSWVKRIRNLDDFWLAWMLDICAGSVGHREAIFHGELSEGLEAVFIDHGHLFGGPRGEQRFQFQTPRYLDGRVYRHHSSNLIAKLRSSVANVDSERLWLSVRSLPLEWKTESSLRRFSECIDTLSRLNRMERVIEKILKSYCQAHAIAIDDQDCGSRPEHRISCPCLADATSRRSVVA